MDQVAPGAQHAVHRPHHQLALPGTFKLLQVRQHLGQTSGVARQPPGLHRCQRDHRKRRNRMALGVYPNVVRSTPTLACESSVTVTESTASLCVRSHWATRSMSAPAPGTGKACSSDVKKIIPGVNDEQVASQA